MKCRCLWVFLLTVVILAQGVVSLVAGSPGGESGFLDGTGQEARLFKPIRLARLDGDSVVFADINNHAVRKLTREGRVTTLCGRPDQQGHLDGPAARARFSSPHGVAVRSDGAIAVADAGNHVIRLLTPEAGSYRISTLAGQAGKSGNADGGKALFHAPHSVCWAPDGALYVADIGNGSLRRIYAGETSTLASQGLKYPMDLALDAQNRLWIADAGHLTLFRWSQPEGLVRPFSELKLAMPHGLSVASDGSVYVAEMNGNRIVSLDGAGVSTKIYDDGLNKPAAVLWEPGGLWVADLGNHRILRLNLL